MPAARDKPELRVRARVRRRSLPAGAGAGAGPLFNTDSQRSQAAAGAAAASEAMSGSAAEADTAPVPAPAAGKGKGGGKARGGGKPRSGVGGGVFRAQEALPPLLALPRPLSLAATLVGLPRLLVLPVACHPPPGPAPPRHWPLRRGQCLGGAGPGGGSAGAVAALLPDREARGPELLRLLADCLDPQQEMMTAGLLHEGHWRCWRSRAQRWRRRRRRAARARCGALGLGSGCCAWAGSWATSCGCAAVCLCCARVAQVVAAGAAAPRLLRLLL
jgi:hypothetical protein